MSSSSLKKDVDKKYINIPIYVCVYEWQTEYGVGAIKQTWENINI